MMLAGRNETIGPYDVGGGDLKSWSDFGHSRQNTGADSFRTFSETAGSGLLGLADFAKLCTRPQFMSVWGRVGGGSGCVESWECGLSPVVAVARAPLRL
jgi:hypothetical protein